jgi:O-antigen/teichoic acid export membrane protein
MDRQTRRTVAVSTAAAVNVGLNLYFIPRWSYLGAGITTVICETGLLAAYAFILRRAVGRSALGEAVAVPALATLPLAVAILVTGHQPLVVSAGAGAIAYGIAMVAIAASRVSPEQRHRPKAMWMGVVKGAT